MCFWIFLLFSDADVELPVSSKASCYHASCDDDKAKLSSVSQPHLVVCLSKSCCGHSVSSRQQNPKTDMLAPKLWLISIFSLNLIKIKIIWITFCCFNSVINAVEVITLCTKTEPFLMMLTSFLCLSLFKQYKWKDQWDQ